MNKLKHIIYINYCRIFNIKTYHFKVKRIYFDIEEYFYSNIYNELLNICNFELKDYLLETFETFDLDNISNINDL